jgi:hypothetical protein
MAQRAGSGRDYRCVVSLIRFAQFRNRLDQPHDRKQAGLIAIELRDVVQRPAHIAGLPVVNNLSARAGLRFDGCDLSMYANNLTNAHPLMFESRDIADDATDKLYFGRGVRPRTIGITATYRY